MGSPDAKPASDHQTGGSAGSSNLRIASPNLGNTFRNEWETRPARAGFVQRSAAVRLTALRFLKQP